MEGNQDDSDLGLLAQLRSDTFDLATWDRFVRRIERWIDQNFEWANLDSANLAGEAALIAYQNVGQFRGDSRFFRWVRTITFRVVYRHLQKNKPGIVITFDDLMEEPAGEDESVMAWKRLVAEEALQNLTEQERQVFILRKQDGMDHREIAARLEISENASRLTWTRAAEKIGRFVQDNDP